jgi:hypothetical protein
MEEKRQFSLTWLLTLIALAALTLGSFRLGLVYQQPAIFILGVAASCVGGGMAGSWLGGDDGAAIGVAAGIFFSVVAALSFAGNASR